MFIPDPNFSIPDLGSKRHQIRNRNTEFKNFLPQKMLTRFVYPGSGFFPILNPGRGQKSAGSRDRIRNTALEIYVV